MEHLVYTVSLLQWLGTIGNQGFRAAIAVRQQSLRDNHWDPPSKTWTSKDIIKFDQNRSIHQSTQLYTIIQYPLNLGDFKNIKNQTSVKKGSLDWFKSEWIRCNPSLKEKHSCSGQWHWSMNHAGHIADFHSKTVINSLVVLLSFIV